MIRLRDKIRTLWYTTKYQCLLRRATFGSNTIVRSKLKIIGPGKVTIGSNCCIETDPWGKEYVTIYTHRPDARVVIGNNVVLRATRFGCHLSISIQDDAILESASIYDSDFHNVDATQRDEGFNEDDRPVNIGKSSYIGCECLCSKGTNLGQNVIMLPGTVIGTKRIPENSLVSGNPAKIIKKD